MDWSDGAEKYLAAHYGETIDDPRPPLDAVEPPACEECGEDVLEAAERLCDTCLANERGRSLLAPSCTDCGADVAGEALLCARCRITDERLAARATYTFTDCRHGRHRACPAVYFADDDAEVCACTCHRVDVDGLAA